MTNSILKKYSYQDFKLNFEKDRVKVNDLSVCASYNVDFSSGSIKPLSGFAEVFKNIFSEEEYSAFLDNTGELLSNLTYYTEYAYFSEERNCFVNRIFVIDSENKLYELDRDALNFRYLSIRFKNSFIYAFERDKFFYISCPNNMMVYFRLDSPPIIILIYCDTTSIEYFQDLTVFSVRNKRFEIYYSTDKNFDTSTSNLSYFTELQLESTNGEVLSVKKFGSAIYVVQQYAITKLNYSGGILKAGSVTPISSKILNGSIYTLRDNLIFCTSAGICLFDGVNLKYYFTDGIRKIENKNFSFTVYNDKYYFIQKSENDNILVELNISNSTFNLYNIGKIDKIYTIKNALKYNLVALLDESGKHRFLELDESLPSDYTKYIKFNKLVFDNSITKILSCLQLCSTGEFLLRITTDLSTREFSVSGNLCLRNLGLQGNYFQIEIMSDENFNIESLTFTIETFSEKL